MLRVNIFLTLGFLLGLNTMRAMDIESGNMPNFDKIKWDLQVAATGLSPIQTQAFYCRKYGYNGRLIHIVKHPEICGTGFIIEGAQPSLFWGYWYEDSCVPQNLIFIEDNNVKYEAKIKNGGDTEPKILSSSLYSNGSKNTMTYTFAVMWKVATQLIKRSDGESRWKIPLKDTYYITRASLSEIQSQNNVFDLDVNKIEVPLRP